MIILKMLLMYTLYLYMYTTMAFQRPAPPAVVPFTFACFVLFVCLFVYLFV